MEALYAAGAWVASLFTEAGFAYGAAAEVGTVAAGETAVAAGAGSAAGFATYATYAQMAAAAVTGVSAVDASLQQRDAAKYNAAMGRSNAELAAMQAGAAEDSQRRRANVILGEQRAAVAQSGVDPSSGSGLLVQLQSVANAELDALNVRYEGMLRGRGLLAQSQLDDRQAHIYGSNAYLNAAGGAAGTFGAYAAGKGNYMRVKAGGYTSGGY